LVEYWRDTLLGSDDALQDYMKAVPHLSPEQLQAMRTAMRQARKDASTGKPPKNARVLFQLIKETLLANPASSTSTDTEASDD
jgi:ribosome-associated protein